MVAVIWDSFSLHFCTIAGVTSWIFSLFLSLANRYLDDFRTAEDKLTDLITALLQEKEYVEFLVGRDGDFDQIVTSTIIRVKRLYGSNSSSLIWVLPLIRLQTWNAIWRLMRATTTK